MAAAIEINGRRVGSGDPCFIIAEAGVNHNGDLQIAKDLVDAAAAAGVDAIKFQSFKADQLASLSAPKADYQARSDVKDETQLEMLKRLELTEENHYVLSSYCQDKGIMFLSTPFDSASADLLEKLEVPAYKIGSGELTNDPFLQYIARKDKPIILSTGMADLDEVNYAVELIKEAGNDQLVLLHCVSNYPADPIDVNLKAMRVMKETLNLPVGYSDHTLGIEVSLAAVGLGACVIEKHFTMSTDLPGPDHKASIMPEQLNALVVGIRKVENALGDGVKKPAQRERNTAEVARRSLVAAIFIPEGSVIEERHIMILRPGTGIPPRMLSEVIGMTANQDIEAGKMLKMEMLS